MLDVGPMLNIDRDPGGRGPWALSWSQNPGPKVLGLSLPRRRGCTRPLLSVQKTQLQQLLFKNEERASGCWRVQSTNELFPQMPRMASRADSSSYLKPISEATTQLVSFLSQESKNSTGNVMRVSRGEQSKTAAVRGSPGEQWGRARGQWPPLCQQLVSTHYHRRCLGGTLQEGETGCLYRRWWSG